MNFVVVPLCRDCRFSCRDWLLVTLCDSGLGTGRGGDRGNGMGRDRDTADRKHLALEGFLLGFSRLNQVSARALFFQCAQGTGSC